MVDLHRHSEFSQFDGMGKAKDLAKIAVELGYTSLGISDHGNTNGLVQHYFACKDAGIKPIMGIETYFLPVYKPQTRGFHLCLFAKNIVGYGNLNKLLWDAEEKDQKYYNTIITFEQLEKYHEGIICTSACVAGYVSQCCVKGNPDKAIKAVNKFKSIFGDDFYIEIQPYKIDDKGTQEQLNRRLIKVAEKCGVKCILTSDSHYGSKDDFDSYLKMHEIAGHDLTWIENTYSERYMPSEVELRNRFCSMYRKELGIKARELASEMISNLEEIEDKVEDEILEKLQLELPKVSEEGASDSYKLLLQKVKEGLRSHKHWTDKYINRCKDELEVIKYHGFEDYFLIVADYVAWAKSQGIFVGPGRGSVCNSQVAYELGITTVDSLFFNLDFRRFLRKDKKSLPDIDLDFETSRRGEVIDYMMSKYKGHASQICSYGLYKVDNLVNDLAKVCGLPVDKSTDAEQARQNKKAISEIKAFLRRFETEEGFDYAGLEKSTEAKYYNKQYDNIIKHFSKLFGKVRFIGTHAAGVAITGGNLLDYVGMRKDKEGKTFTNYDLADLDRINVVKFDFLGLKTMESLGELRRLTGRDNTFDITAYLDDKEVLQAYREGKTDGVFQFVSSSAKGIVKDIGGVDNFEDIVAVNAMNRPGPLSLHMPETYGKNKMNQDEMKNSPFWEYTKETYGTIVYQEQLMQICVNIGEMDWSEADKVMKLMKHAEAIAENEEKRNEAKALTDKFVKGALNHGFTEEKAREFFQSLLVYTFNRGHAVGYSLISFEEMFYKVHYPAEYWYTKIKYAKDDKEKELFCEKAVESDIIIFLPHVNLSRSKTTLRKEDGERVIQQGLSDLNGVGEKAASYILQERKKNGAFRNYDDFYDRCKIKGSPVTSRVIDILKEQGALEFKKKIYIGRVKKYNSTLFMKSMRQ